MRRVRLADNHSRSTRLKVLHLKEFSSMPPYHNKFTAMAITLETVTLSHHMLQTARSTNNVVSPPNILWQVKLTDFAEDEKFTNFHP
jgi:hypothetical protein